MISSVQQQLRSLRQRLDRRRRRKMFRLTALRRFRNDRSILATTLVRDEETFEVAGPRFIGDGFYVDAPSEVSVTAPRIEIIEFSKVAAIGGTNLVFSAGKAVHPDIVDPIRDMFMAETAGAAAFFPPNELHVVTHPERLKVKEAVSLLGECNGNYAHWLFETLPKLIVLDQQQAYRNLPLLVDGWIHPIFYQTLVLLNSNRRPIERVHRWQLVELERLVYVTPPSYTAPENREFHSTGKKPVPTPSSYSFSPKEMALLRQKAVAWARRFIAHGSVVRGLPNLFRVDGDTSVRAAVHDPPPTHDHHVRYGDGRLLYLKRAPQSAGNPRQLIAQERVEAILADHGFVAVDPAILTFSEQVMLLQNAKCVVAPIGAALANAVFAPPGLKILCLAPYYQGADYYYFSNMMGALGHELYFVLGPQMEQPNVHWLHRDYIVDLQALKAGVSQLCR